MNDFLVKASVATANTFAIYLPAWFLGSLLGLVLSYVSWLLPRMLATKTYYFLSGMSFIPVTILIPYFLRTFGLSLFIYPLLSLPAMLVIYSSQSEAYEFTNQARATLLYNYSMPKSFFFMNVVLRESLPSLKSAARQTLSLCFAIFLAIDYYVGFWGGLGALASHYYDISSSSNVNELLLFLVISLVVILGLIQVRINDSLFEKATEFRRHY